MTDNGQVDESMEDTQQERPTMSFKRPVGDGERQVRQGESVMSIAKQTGHFWRTIWDDPANVPLREARRNPSILLPGDRIHVPETRPKDVEGQTEQRHRFRRRGEPATLKITFRRFGESRANESYQATIDGRHYSGALDDQGRLHMPVPGDAQRATIIVGEGDTADEYAVKLHHLNPADHETGIQQRLNNLGYPCEATGEIDEQTQAALTEYRKKHGVATSGRCDESIKDELKQEHVDV